MSFRTTYLLIIFLITACGVKKPPVPKSKKVPTYFKYLNNNDQAKK